MLVDVLVGCQYGSEGKGLVSAYLDEWSREDRGKGYDLLVSVNSSQAGHTTHKEIDGEIKYFVTRQLPASAVANIETPIFIAPGAIVNLDVLFQEIKMLEEAGIPIQNRLYISEQATVITHADEEEERARKMFEAIGSTMEGVGSALSKHVMRTGPIMSDFVDTIHRLYPDVVFVHNAPGFYRNNTFRLILLEGSQGFGLGINYRHYPKCTSRDTTTAGALAGAQLRVTDIARVYGVFRTFPIRVAGASGHLYGELTWEELAKVSGYDTLHEITTVTKRTRRVGQWDKELALDAMYTNGVTHPILTFVNYLNRNDEGKTRFVDFTRNTQEWIAHSGIEWHALSTSKTGGIVRYRD